MENGKEAFECRLDATDNNIDFVGAFEAAAALRVRIRVTTELAKSFVNTRSYPEAEACLEMAMRESKMMNRQLIEIIAVIREKHKHQEVSPDE